MTYKEALRVTTHDFILKVAVPGWALGLTPRLRKVKLGFEELYVCVAKNTLPCLLFFWGEPCVDIYDGDDTRASSGGWQGGASWSA